MSMGGEGQKCLLTGPCSPDSVLPTTLGVGVLIPTPYMGREFNSLPQGAAELAPRPNTTAAALPSMDCSGEGLTPWGEARTTPCKIVFNPQLSTRADFGTEKVISDSIIRHYRGRDVTTSSLLLGTRQMQFVPKLVSRV